MAHPAPGVNRHAQTPLDRTGSCVAARVRLFFVVDQICGNLEFFGVNLGPIRQRNVFQEKLQFIHFQRCGRVGERGHGQETALRMVRRAPGTLTAAVGADAFAG